MPAPEGSGQTPAGWYADPGGSGQQRYWDGARWTERMFAGGHAPETGSAPGSTVDRIRFTSTLGGRIVVVFDGEVLEIFGPTGETSRDGDSWRFHRDLMGIKMEQPDRKGNLTVEVYPDPGPRPSWRGPVCKVRVSAQDRAVVEFFERVRAALPVE